MPSFELHVWGPAFGLPSIDAECIAAIAYLHKALPSAEWTLIPSSDPSVTAAHRLPALHSTTTDTWSSGYAAIAAQLAQTPYSLDASLTPAQAADVAAYSSYLTTRLAPLLDISLHALPRNWAQTTRPAYSTILPFPLTWTLPTALHAAALDRSAPYLAGLTLPDEDSDDKETTSALDAALKHIPAPRKKSPLEDLAPTEAATIRLHALALDALAPLNALRAEGEESPGTRLRLSPSSSSSADPDTPPTSLDCLALGYLSLIRRAPVPHDFLRKALEANFPTLARMTADLAETCLTAPGPLPWAPDSATPTVARTLSRFAADVLRVTPVAGPYFVSEARRRAEDPESGAAMVAARALGLLAVGSAVAYGAWTYRGMAPFGLKKQAWARPAGGRLGQFGALGAMLDFSLGGAPDTWAQGEGASHAIVEAEVDVE
ncbi:hypothetical protein VDGD_06131 [Verticillium dahliae]|nr:hypothetical protein VDGD_06131 [Verticillium dahliae]